MSQTKHGDDPTLIGVWLIKHSLTTGIIEEYVIRRDDVRGGYALIKRRGYTSMYYRVGKDVFLTPTEALEAANLLRQRMVDYANRRMEKWSKLKFAFDRGSLTPPTKPASTGS